MTALDGETAADNSQPRGVNAALNSLTKEAKAGLSDAGPALQST